MIQIGFSFSNGPVLFLLIFSILGSVACEDCKPQWDGFIEALERGETWALIMRDAWGSRPSGLNYGNLVDYGNFDQCFSFAHAHPSLGSIQAQYCLVPVEEKNSSVVQLPAYRMATCLPRICKADEVKGLIEQHLAEQGFNVLDFDPNVSCEKPLRPQWTPLEWFGLVFFCLSIGTVTAATALDAMQRWQRKQSGSESCKRNHVISSFSAYSNLAAVLSYANTATTITKTAPPSSSSPVQLHCLHGVRGISVLWIIYQHTYYMQMSYPLINDNYKYQWSEHLFGMTYKSASVVVDNFLFVSGLLLVWNFLHDRQKGKPLNLMKMYANRYIRITTALAPIILFTVTFLRFSGSGPEWSIRSNQIIGFCDKYWWSALLHIQNYVNPAEVCVGQSWYLSVDMQLFILSPLLLIPISKWGSRVLWIVVALIGLILIYIFVIVLHKEIYISIFLRDTLDRVKYIYMPTHVKAVPWLLGIIVGFHLFQNRGKPMQISKPVYVLLWLLSISAMCGVIFGPFEAHKPYSDVGKIATALHSSLSGFVWVMAVAWIVVACSRHQSGIGNKFLSHHLWLPVSRLSFSVYLVHLHLQYMLIASTKINGHFSDIETLHAYFGDVGYALIIGLVWYLVYEIPFCHLAKHYLGSTKATVDKRIDTTMAQRPSQVIVA